MLLLDSYHVNPVSVHDLAQAEQGLQDDIVQVWSLQILMLNSTVME